MRADQPYCLICGTTFKAAQSSCGDAVAMGALQVRGRDRTVEVFSLGGRFAEDAMITRR